MSKIKRESLQCLNNGAHFSMHAGTPNSNQGSEQGQTNSNFFLSLISQMGPAFPELQLQLTRPTSSNWYGTSLKHFMIIPNRPLKTSITEYREPYYVVGKI
jgi:hypothetical protein